MTRAGDEPMASKPSSLTGGNAGLMLMGTNPSLAAQNLKKTRAPFVCSVGLKGALSVDHVLLPASLNSCRPGKQQQISRVGAFTAGPRQDTQWLQAKKKKSRGPPRLPAHHPSAAAASEDAFQGARSPAAKALLSQPAPWKRRVPLP